MSFFGFDRQFSMSIDCVRSRGKAMRDAALVCKQEVVRSMAAVRCALPELVHLLWLARLPIIKLSMRQSQ